MTLLYVHPGCANLGDTLVEAGAKYLIHKAIGWHHFHQIWLNNPGRFEAPIHYDALALIGTPWFWNQMELPSSKYDELRRLAGIPRCWRAVLGAGSAFRLGQQPP